MGLKQQRAAALAAAQTIADGAKAADRTMTAAEIKAVNEHLAEVDRLDGLIAEASKGDDLVRRLGQAAGGSGGERKGHLDLRGIGAALAKGMAAFSGNMQPGVKGLVPSGQTVVQVPFVGGDPLAGDPRLEHAPRLVEVLPVTQREAPAYRYVKQTYVTTPGGAAVVAPGATKPTLKLQVGPADARLRVIAVLSEPVDTFLLEDSDNLEAWVTAQLGDAVYAALETEVLSGDGTGEHFTGLANVSGIQTQAFTTDRITTLAAGMAKLAVLGLTPDYIAVSAADALALQTTRNASGAFDLGGAIDAAAGTAWGVRYVVVPGLAAGDAYIIGEGSIGLSTDTTGLRAAWHVSGDDFETNQIRARVEGRFNLDVWKAHAIVKADLSA